MTTRVRVSGRAEHDVRAILDWLMPRSQIGASRWYDAYLAALDALPTRAQAASRAAEADQLGIALYQVLFKTRKGRSYRCLFMIVDDTIDVVAIRGPGQDIVTLDDLGLAD